MDLEAHLKIKHLSERLEIAEADAKRTIARLEVAEAEAKRLRSLINTPRTDDFFEAVRTEATHQIERWGTDQDSGKSHADWHTLVTALIGKATLAYWGRDWDKRTHHLVSAAAALLNWHRHVTGASTKMRPGVAANHEHPRKPSNLDLVDEFMAREGLDR